MKQNQFFCVMCSKKVMCDKDDIHFKRIKNKKIKGGVPALKCKCKKCDTKLTKFVKKADANMLKKKFN